MGFWYLHVLMILPGRACFGTVDVSAAYPGAAHSLKHRKYTQKYLVKFSTASIPGLI